MAQPALQVFGPWDLVLRNQKGFLILTSFRGCTSHFRFDNFYITHSLTRSLLEYNGSLSQWQWRQVAANSDTIPIQAVIPIAKTPKFLRAGMRQNIFSTNVE